jgi:hypothetical protein
MTGDPRARRADHRVSAVAALQARFPGAVVWYGTHTRTWWAYLPIGERGRLVEAIGPEELARALADPHGWLWPR